MNPNFKNLNILYVTNLKLLELEPYRPVELHIVKTDHAKCCCCISRINYTCKYCCWRSLKCKEYFSKLILRLPFVLESLACCLMSLKPSLHRTCDSQRETESPQSRHLIASPHTLLEQSQAELLP